MFDIAAYVHALGPPFVAAALMWAVSVAKRDVSIVDSVWAALFVLAAMDYALSLGVWGARSIVVFSLLIVWALRLTLYVTWRNWGEPEDHRYREIRARNEPRFWIKSLYLVFGLQALLAWLISLPVLIAVASDTPLGIFDAVGALLVLGGITFESVADWQLARFKRDSANRARVLDTGLWRYSRHPNYFGECCIWWGFYVFALPVGGWWSLLSPLLMTWLLLKISGVGLLEKTIGRRRPAYANYIRATSAFFPMPRRKSNVTRAMTDLQ